MKFLTSAVQWKSAGSNISSKYLIIYKHILNRFKYIVSKNCQATAIEMKICEKVYTKNININLQNVEKVQKK